MTAYFFIQNAGGENVETEYTEDYIQTIATVEDMPAVARGIVSDYCDKNGIDESDIFPSIWNDIISELYFTLFKPCHRLLKTDNALYNEYDRTKVFYVYEYIYKRLCNSHCQEITLKGFTDMTGIHRQNIYNWSNDNKYIYNNTGIELNNSDSSNGSNNSVNSINSGAELNTKSFDMHEKIMQDNEESLFALMKDRRYNPMKLLPKLNKVHGWNMSGVSAQATQQALSSNDIRAMLTQNTRGNEVKQIEIQDVVESDG